MSCDPQMNQKEKMASISFYKNKRLIVSSYNEQHFLYLAFSNFCIICSYHSNERLVMFLPNIYPGLLQVMKMTRKGNGSVPSDDSD